MRERLFEFACVVVRLVQFLHTRGPVASALSYQLLKAGTSAGANYEEADDGSSDRDALAKMLEVPRPTDYGPFLTMFNGWFLMTAVYFVFLLAVQLLLWIGRNRPEWPLGLHDEWFYAVVVVMINVKMFVYNCTNDAPMIQTCLVWASDNLRRARAFTLRSAVTSA